jgi:hypothetical protein
MTGTCAETMTISESFSLSSELLLLLDPDLFLCSKTVLFFSDFFLASSKLLDRDLLLDFDFLLPSEASFSLRDRFFFPSSELCDRDRGASLASADFGLDGNVLSIL